MNKLTSVARFLGRPIHTSYEKLENQNIDTVIQSSTEEERLKSFQKFQMILGGATLASAGIMLVPSVAESVEDITNRTAFEMGTDIITNTGSNLGFIAGGVFLLGATIEAVGIHRAASRRLEQLPKEPLQADQAL
jgi:hypothetical protein